MADALIEALRSSVDRLHDLVAGVPVDQLTRRAYPDQWSIADVLSHLGSGAVITKRRLDDTLAGVATSDDFAPEVWDTWNGKNPESQRDDALIAEAQLLSGIDAVTAKERAAFTSEMGPMTFDFKQFVAMRLREHALHTWDIEVADDATATVNPKAAALIVDNLELIARFTAKPNGETGTITITTTEPRRGFTIELAADAVRFTSTHPGPGADLTLSAEAFIRLVYGRLDREHTPADPEADRVATLRQVFPGP
jgi:uncharacterized protein (TIGR03083 family)